VNAAGAIAGEWDDFTCKEEGPFQNAYLFQSGVFTPIDHPWGIVTFALGINDSGTIVGWFAGFGPFSGDHGYVLKDGIYTYLVHPQYGPALARGISAKGQIVGNAGLHGFIATPVE
jgi:hypothetical protein